jgi:hypothetical protein
VGGLVSPASADVHLNTTDQRNTLTHTLLLLLLHSSCMSCRGSWKRMFLNSPHLRFDGLYVSRNTYIRQGVAEWKREKTCHLVTYFRYFRCVSAADVLCCAVM